MSLINTLKTKVQSKFNVGRMSAAIMNNAGMQSTLMGEKNWNKAGKQIKALIMANKPNDAIKYARDQARTVAQQQEEFLKGKREHKRKVAEEHMKEMREEEK